MSLAEVGTMNSFRRASFTPADEEKMFRDKPDYDSFHEGIRKDRLPFLKGFRKTVIPVLENHIDRKTLQIALEIGTGTGFFPRDLAPEWLRQKLLSIDINKRSLEEAQKDPRMSQVACASAYNLPMDNESVDTVIGYSSFDSLLFLKEALRETERVLKPKGKIILFQDLTPELYQIKRSHKNKAEEYEAKLTAVETYHTELFNKVCRINFEIQEGNTCLVGEAEEPITDVFARVPDFLKDADKVTFPLGGIWDRGVTGVYIKPEDLQKHIDKFKKIFGWKEKKVFSYIVRMRYLVAQKK